VIVERDDRSFMPEQHQMSINGLVTDVDIF